MTYTFGPALALLALRDSQHTWTSRQPHHFTSLRVGQNEWTWFHGDVEIVEHLEVQSDRHLVITGDLRIGRTLDIGVDACVYVGGALTAEAVRCTGRVIASTIEARALIVLRALRSAALVARSVTTQRLMHGDAERYATRWDVGAESAGDGDALFDALLAQ